MKYFNKQVLLWGSAQNEIFSHASFGCLPLKKLSLLQPPNFRILSWLFSPSIYPFWKGKQETQTRWSEVSSYLPSSTSDLPRTHSYVLGCFFISNPAGHLPVSCCPKLTFLYRTPFSQLLPLTLRINPILSRSHKHMDYVYKNTKS